MATGNYHALLGVAPRLGRTLTPADDNPASPAVAVLAEGYWRSRFSADPGIIGKVVRINNLPVTIVGVAAEPFSGTQRVSAEPSSLTMPLRLEDQISGDLPRPERSDGVVGSGDGQAQAGHHPVKGARQPLSPVFQRQARAGMDAFFWGSASEEVRNLRKTKDRQPFLTCLSIRRAAVRTTTTSARYGADPPRHCRLTRATARVRERGKPSSFARSQAATRDFRPALPRRDAREPHPPATDRKPHAVCGRWGPRPCARSLGSIAAARAGRHDGTGGLAHSRLYGRRDGNRWNRIRHCPRAARNEDRSRVVRSKKTTAASPARTRFFPGPCWSHRYRFRWSFSWARDCFFTP